MYIILKRIIYSKVQIKLLILYFALSQMPPVSTTMKKNYKEKTTLSDEIMLEINV